MRSFTGGIRNLALISALGMAMGIHTNRRELPWFDRLCPGHVHVPRDKALRTKEQVVDMKLKAKVRRDARNKRRATNNAWCLASNYRQPYHWQV